MLNKYIRSLKSIPKLGEKHCRYTSISMFTGGGGLDLGLYFAGFKTVFATDVESCHCKTIRTNFPDCIVEQYDIKDLTGDIIRQVTNQKNFDLLAGGPPCQAFSILGLRNSFEDPRGNLVFEYIRLINELRPKAFVFENVPGLLTLNGGSDWKTLLNYFKDETGYTIFKNLLNAADFGVPQVRNRIFVVGFRDNNTSFKFPEPIYSSPESNRLFDEKMKRWLPARFALVAVKGLPNHRIRPHTKKVMLRYSKLQPGERDKVDHTDRIHPDRPSGTVLVGSKAGGGRPFIHPFEDRHLTVREAARLQSFPDWYVFRGPNTWQYRAVGNAVPPLLAKAIGHQIQRALDSMEEKECPEICLTQDIHGH